MRKVIGVSPELHLKIQNVSEKEKLPMTVVMEQLLDMADQVDWEEVREEYRRNKPTWDNIRSLVKEYLEKNPKASDEMLSRLTGFSLRQIETVTHSAHRRCIRFFRKGGTLKNCPEKCNVSPAFAKRIYGMIRGRNKIPRSEKYLFNEGEK